MYAVFGAGNQGSEPAEPGYHLCSLLLMLGPGFEEK